MSLNRTGEHLKRLASGALIACLLFTACAKTPPNLTPVQQSQFKSDRYLSALSDFQDGVEVGYITKWLSKGDTHIVAQILAVTAVTIHEYPEGARAAALAALDEITAKVDMKKFEPYVYSVRLIVENLK